MSCSLLMPVLVLAVGFHNGVSAQREKELSFDNYPGQKLTLPLNMTGAKQESTLVEDNMECVFQCTSVQWCRSINFKTTPQSNGLHVCELLSSDQFTSKSYMTQGKAYNHYSVKNPCEETPCHNDGECIFEDNRRDYRCKCKERYSGNHCEVPKNKHCADVLNYGEKQSGVYTIDPDGKGAFKVFCDQTTNGGRWTVFQKRKDGSVDFYRVWDAYKKGFGDLKGEFWLGLDRIHRLTHQARNRLRVDLEDTKGNSAYAEYDNFVVSSEQNKYKLSDLGAYSGTAGDSLTHHHGMAFTTKDRDNDVTSGNCAVGWGAWWYRGCMVSSLNGMYNRSIIWYYWKNDYSSLKKAEMKIRPD